MIARQLLFLFSALGAINGIFVAVYFFSRRPRNIADCMLGALLLAVGVRTAKSAFLFFNPAIALEFRQLGLSACLLIGPLTYLYIRYFIAGIAQLPAGQQWRWHLGLSFLLIGIGIVFPYSAYRHVWDFSSHAIHVFWLGYLLATARLLWQTRREWLNDGDRMATSSMLLLSVFAGSGIMLAAYATTPFTSYIVGALSFTFSLHVAVLAFLLRKEVSTPSDARQKYKNSRLTQEDALAVLASLEQLMTGQKLYLNPNLTLVQLAKRAGCTQAQLSQVLNDKLSKSFTTYVNEYRIAEAKQVLAGQPQLNLDIVAERCGFNSSSTFFSTFKKVAGQTPASFRTQSGQVSGAFSA
ncbi:helix-turn-helix transcriptional regulator [Duganella sp. sic0402]|uniref:helix-turn-helix transcriptional regulator n=1 Tax=Duganella sp. sic0402 TaxID=2854786 RepID=UPI001C471F89|nr:helix-turn-helix transcriptional regulator [Duganella sp. sic0402]MBV7539285.1 helix-turn-helix transcriptional regulator [Duganella sp. sic0402]